MKENSVAAKLTALRAAKGATQEEVAKTLGVSNKTVSKWENGKSFPDLSMLSGLAQYYKVSIDALLDPADAAKDPKELTKNEFNGLHRHEIALKIFETVKNRFPAVYSAVDAAPDGQADLSNAIPPQTDEGRRYQVTLPELFDFAVCSDDVNFAVVQLQNRKNFAWLLDEKKRSRMAELFGFLADVDSLKILSFIHSRACSDNFTVEYMSKNTGVCAKKTSEILEKCTEFGVCSKMTAHLKTGTVAVYESFGDGLLLSMLSIAYERMCGQENYSYNFNEGCKMIGGKKA